MFPACAALLAAGLFSFAAQAQKPAAMNPEQQLSQALTQMQSGEARAALRNLESLTRAEPNFRLGQLMYGELLAALSGAGAGTLMAAADSDPRLQELAEEGRLRLASEKAVPPPGAVPNSVLKLANSHRHAILVDLPRARMYLLENKKGALKLVRHHYAAMGRNGYGKRVTGDLRTPVGIYHITSWIGDDKLPELYGSGAYPLSYPNPWDTFHKRTGSGIWLHGVPRSTYSRAPRSSEGCVTMANDDLSDLKKFVDLGQTPVILSDNVEWLPADKNRGERDQWLSRLEDWRRSWASLDTESYLDYYGPEFTFEGMNRSAFVAHKRRVNKTKKFIRVQLSDINLFQYPGAGEPLVLAEFRLHYKSDNFSSVAQKQQFWRQEKNGQWKIFREENR